MARPHRCEVGDVALALGSVGAGDLHGPAAAFKQALADGNAALVDVKVTSRFDEFGGLVLPGSPAEFGTFIAKDTDKWGKVVKFAGLKPE